MPPTPTRANWNDLPDIESLPPLSEVDKACLEEVREVLERYGKTKLFGVQLLHKHFQVADDEIFLETQDPATRTLTLRAVKQDELQGVERRSTSWRLDGGVIRAMSDCAGGGYFAGHYGYKD